MSARLSLLTHTFWTIAPSCLESSSDPPSMLETSPTQNKLLNSQLTLVVSNSTGNRSMKSLDSLNFHSVLMASTPRENRVTTLSTVRSSTKPGTLKTPSQRNWPRELPSSLDPKPNKISSSLWEAPMPKGTKICSQWSTLVSWPMLMSNLAWSTASKTSLRAPTTTAWRNSWEIGRRWPNNRKLTFFWLEGSRSLRSFARRSSNYQTSTKRWFLSQ